MGYHKSKIKKGVLGEFSKVSEEYHELLDAIEQEVDVLQLVECSDLIGAIEAYTLNKWNVSLEQLIRMKQLTQKAFEDGTRTNQK